MININISIPINTTENKSNNRKDNSMKKIININKHKENNPQIIEKVKDFYVKHEREIIWVVRMAATTGLVYMSYKLGKDYGITIGRAEGYLEGHNDGVSEILEDPKLLTTASTVWVATGKKMQQLIDEVSADDMIGFSGGLIETPVPMSELPPSFVEQMDLDAYPKFLDSSIVGAIFLHAAPDFVMPNDDVINDVADAITNVQS